MTRYTRRKRNEILLNALCKVIKTLDEEIILNVKLYI